MPASEQGVNFDRYVIVPRTLIFLVRGTTILLIKGASNKRLWPGLYNGVGGHVEQGEDLQGAARRELLEETGLESSDLFLCGIVTVDTQRNPGVCLFIFKGNLTGGKLGESNEGALEWVQISDLNRIPLVSDLPFLLPKILSTKSDNVPFYAHSMYDENGNLQTSFL